MNNVISFSGAYGIVIAKSDNIILFDYGLTQFDNGATENLYDSFTLNPDDLKFKVRPVGYNNSTGGTFYDLYELTGITTSDVGNFFELDGGYLQGFYKLEGYNFEQLPARFDNGMTIETNDDKLSLIFSFA